MKLEYFAEGSPQCPLILIYGSNSSGTRELQQAFISLLNGKTNRIAVHELTGFESVDGCELFVSVGTSDLGVSNVAEATFEWILRPEVWEDIAWLTEPFVKPSNEAGTRFQ